jgi:site-specific recombinase XerD
MFCAGVPRAYPHLLWCSTVTTRLERGMPIEPIQQCLGHAKLETAQIDAASSATMITERDQQALAGCGVP